MVQWCWVNFQCWGVILIWIKVGQGPTTLAVGAGGGCLDFSFSLSLEYGPILTEILSQRDVNPKQPTNLTESLLMSRHIISKTVPNLHICLIRQSLDTLKCLSLGSHKDINFAFAPNGKLLFYVAQYLST